MTVIGRLSLYCLFAILMAFAQAVAAVPIPVGSTPADDLIFNFNFTSSSPPPPYDIVKINATFSGGSFPDVITEDAFGGLGGTGGPVGVPISFLATKPSSFLGLSGFPQLSDGIFSVGFRINAGTAEVTSTFATAFATDSDANATISGVPAVPEPATLALLGVGLAGLGLARRRSRGLQSTAV